jgi:NodT family efflux transporter outer membrane factor (OMF) lipoprotein
MKSSKTTWTLLTVSLALAGCSAIVQTPYSQPEVRTPAQWQALATTAAATAADSWWRQFQDPKLNDLVEAALRSNNDLAVATIRVRRAQLAAGLAQSDLAPSVSAGADVGRRRSLEDGSVRTRSASASVGVSYELDLWGRLGNQRDAARWAAVATEEDRRSTALTLVGTTMNLYWQAAFLNQRIAHAEESIAHARRTLELIRTQYEAGAVSGLEVAEAEGSLASQQQTLSELQQQRVENSNALAILLNGPPGTATPVPQELPEVALPEVDAGLPAGLLGRRPDLRAAELRLRQALANTDAVRASYYPSLSLTGSVGASSTSLNNVLQNPIAVLGVGINLPFLQWKQMELNIASSKTQFEEAVVNFRQSLYQAMSDVENALSARVQLARQAEFLQGTLASARRAEELYEVRYRSGAVSLRNWLDAQQQRRAAEIAVAQNRLLRYNNQVLLYQALGGDSRL